MVVPSRRPSARSPSSTSAPIGAAPTAPSKDCSTGRGPVRRQLHGSDAAQVLAPVADHLVDGAAVQPGPLPDRVVGELDRHLRQVGRGAGHLGGVQGGQLAHEDGERPAVERAVVHVELQRVAALARGAPAPCGSAGPSPGRTAAGRTRRPPRRTRRPARPRSDRTGPAPSTVSGPAAGRRPAPAGPARSRAGSAGSRAARPARRRPGPARRRRGHRRAAACPPCCRWAGPARTGR